MGIRDMDYLEVEDVIADDEEVEEFSNIDEPLLNSHDDSCELQLRDSEGWVSM